MLNNRYLILILDRAWTAWIEKFVTFIRLKFKARIISTFISYLLHLNEYTDKNFFIIITLLIH